MLFKRSLVSICAIVGTRHAHSNTEYFTRRYIEELKIKQALNIEFEVLNLTDYHLSNCIGCYHCAKNNQCNLNDDMEFLKEKIMHADIIILATPVYMNNVSGIMKTLLDRLHMWTKVMLLSGKLGIILTTSSHKGGELGVHSYLSNISCNMGMLNMGAFNMTLDAPRELYNQETETGLLKNFVCETLDNINKASGVFITQVHEMVFKEIKSQVKGLGSMKNSTFIYQYWEDSGMLSADSFEEFLNNHKNCNS